MNLSGTARRVGLALLFLALPIAASAACPGNTQREMNDCAKQRYDAADAELNAAWKPARSFFDGLGKGDVLLDAQRKWLAFRDAACLAETTPYEGGSIVPLVHFDCMTRLTLQRTETLRHMTAN